MIIIYEGIGRGFRRIFCYDNFSLYLKIELDTSNMLLWYLIFINFVNCFIPPIQDKNCDGLEIKWIEEIFKKTKTILVVSEHDQRCSSVNSKCETLIAKIQLSSIRYEIQFN
jgi:hypothetical protein